MSVPRSAAESIVRTLRGAGFVAYFAGGCVRDELLGLVPSDYDVATSATPDDIRRVFNDRHTSEVGAAFGVVLVREQHVTIEVATFRRDGPYSDKRRPDSVEFADEKSDAERRDFTVNALFIDPLNATSDRGERGRVIDHVDGRRDLEARILRAVGDPDARLNEDHLRALRAVRFAARLGFTIDGATTDAIRRHASQLAGVSRERIGEEIKRMFAHPSRAVAATLLHALALDGPALESDSLGPATFLHLERIPADASFALSLAAWAMDRGIRPASAPAVDALGVWRRALCLSNDVRDELAGYFVMVGNIERLWTGAGVARRKRWASSKAFDGSVALLDVANSPAAGVVQRDVEALRSTPGGLQPVPMVTGDELVRAGLVPGPGFGRILDGVYDAQLEGRIGSVEEALTLARELATMRNV